MAGALDILLPKLRRAVAQFSHLPRTLALTWAAAPRWTLCRVARLAVQGLVPAAMVFSTKLVVDAVVVAHGQGFDWQTLRPVLLWGAVMGLLMLAAELLQVLGGYMITAQAQ